MRLLYIFLQKWEQFEKPLVSHTFQLFFSHLLVSIIDFSIDFIHNYCIFLNTNNIMILQRSFFMNCWNLDKTFRYIRKRHIFFADNSDFNFDFQKKSWFDSMLFKKKTSGRQNKLNRTQFDQSLIIIKNSILE